MSKKEKEVFYTMLKDIKVFDAYASNTSRCVSLKDRRLYSLKSHDYHILMQDLLPVALRCCMSKKVTSCIIELSNIMKAICGKVLIVEELDKVQDRVTLTLCNLEKIFPPSFFTITVHLLIHLPHEAKFGWPVFYRWMYPIERFLCKFKSYYRNKRYPKGSIAEGYLVEEFRRLKLFDITHRKKDGSPMTTEAAEIMEKLKDKREEYKAIALSDSSVNLDDIDNRIITEVLGPKRLRNQMAQMQASTVEQIVQLIVEAASREAKAQRKYDELQLQLKAEAAAKESEATAS
ncbi:hypothetical protein PVK06_042795 [Gossypium arboreum]|uniref:DUF4218 domain-containing protein n=1 Tax=Gossypium arboreum TaxID=29729 RepID=A0ABR0MM84_GOSAR|nr:hypothetical protein PVK06_042795 [Gossypium arboreum]